MQYVIDGTNRSLSDVILAGDSAGGQLCLALLSHISHPCPDVPELEATGKLKALVVIGPWVSFRIDWPSNYYNAYKDIISSEVARRWAMAYLGGRKSNNYIGPVEAPATWWKDARVQQLLCVAGTDELLIDPITEWVEKYNVSSQVRMTGREVDGNPRSVETCFLLSGDLLCSTLSLSIQTRHSLLVKARFT